MQNKGKKSNNIANKTIETQRFNPEKNDQVKNGQTLVNI